MTKKAQAWVMARRPVGEVTAEHLQLRDITLPELRDGDILVRNLWLSLDPYMRGRMRDARSYATPLQEGEVVTGETVGVVEQSRSPRWHIGDHVAVHTGWRSHTVVAGTADEVFAIDPKIAPPEFWLGTIGMPARTAWFGLKEVGKPQAGETLVVSAASGAVGSMVGQLAKAMGLRVVGIAGGAHKCAWCTDQLGMDACVDYKRDDYEAQLASACPDGVDIYFENVGGKVTQAVLSHLNPGARVPICGFISMYNSEEADFSGQATPFAMLAALKPTPEHRFFLVYECREQWLQISTELASMIDSGALKYRHSVTEGLENALTAFQGLFRGENFGKQLVKIADA